MPPRSGSDPDADLAEPSKAAPARDAHELGILAKATRPTLRDGEVPSTTVDCPHAALCSGCALIQLDYVEQLAVKRAGVVESMSRFPALEFVYTSAVEPADPIVGYRTRAHLLVAPPNLVGLSPATSRPPLPGGRPARPVPRGAPPSPVLDIPDCRILTPALAELAAALRSLLLAPRPEVRALLLPYDAAGGGSLRGVELREVQSVGPGGVHRTGVIATWVMQRDRSPAIDELRAAAASLLAELPRAVALSVKLFDASGPQAPEIHLAGERQVEDLVGSTAHLASYGTYVLGHREQAARLHAMVVREVASLDIEPQKEGEEAALPPAERTRVLDLYGGAGTLSLALTRANNDVVMVEASKSAVDLARAAVEAQGLRGLAIRHEEVEDALANLLRERAPFDVVVVNPPRRGISPVAREAMTKLGPTLIIYVASDTDSLARDLDHLARLGYVTAEILPIDAAPLGVEVETVAVIRRGPPARPLVIFENEEIVVVDKEAHEPVEPHPEYTSSVLGRLEATGGAHRLIPLHRIEPGTSGVCMLARNDAAAAKWQRALAATGRPIYLAGVKGTTPSKGAITRELRDKDRSSPARTRYRRLAIAAGHSVLRVLPDAGLTHQIRRHLAAIGHPVLGDERYGHEPTNRYFEERMALDRDLIHLVRVEVDHPDSGQKLLFESPLGGDLRATLQRLGGPELIDQLEQKHALGARRAAIPGALGAPAAGFAPGDEAQSSGFPDSTSADARPEHVESAPEGESPRTLRQRIASDDES